MPERMLTADEVAEILGLHPATIRRGGVPGLHPVRVTRRALRFRTSDVQAVMEGRTPDEGSDQVGANQADSHDAPDADERERLAQALGNALAQILSDAEARGEVAGLDRLFKQINRQWTQLLEGWAPEDEDDADDGDEAAPGDHAGPGDEHDETHEEAGSR